MLEKIDNNKIGFVFNIYNSTKTCQTYKHHRNSNETNQLYKNVEISLLLTKWFNFTQTS